MNDVIDDIATIIAPLKEKVRGPQPAEPSIIFDVESYETIDSTSDQLKRLAVRGAQEGKTVFSLAQTRGRGRYGREWVSPKGNFYVSFLLRPKEEVRKLSQLSFVVAVAVGRVVQELLDNPEGFEYKWPNDLLIHQKKVGGIILESPMAADGLGVDWLMVGVGVNMMQYPQSVDFPATSLHAEGANVIPEKKMLDRFLTSFNFAYAEWQQQGFSKIREEWLAHAAFRNKSINVRTAQESYTGIFEGLDPSGELILTMPDGKKRRVSTGEVFFTRET